MLFHTSMVTLVFPKLQSQEWGLIQCIFSGKMSGYQPGYRLNIDTGGEKGGKGQVERVPRREWPWCCQCSGLISKTGEAARGREQRAGPDCLVCLDPPCGSACPGPSPPPPLPRCLLSTLFTEDPPQGCFSSPAFQG